MKKITLLVAAMATMFSASAQWGSTGIGQAGNYNMSTGEWIDAVPAANEPFTFAIKVTDAAAQAWLDGADGRTLALGDARVGDDGIYTKQQIRLIPLGSYVYAIDICIAQLYSAEQFADQTGIKYYHFQLGGASITDGTWGGGNYNYGNIGYGVASAAFNGAATLTGTGLITNPATGVALPGTIIGKPVNPTSIDEALIAEVAAVEYYSILGVKVTADVKGLVIEKTIFADGSSSAKKIVKK